MLTPNSSHTDINPIKPLTRERVIKFLESKGVREIEGKPLEECYTYQLLMVANYWKSSRLRSINEST